MSIFQRWRLKHRIKREHEKIEKLRRETPHSGWVEITRCNAEIRRLTQELAGVQANQRKEPTT